MLVYSQWQPTGGYDYFETSASVPLGDDLPVPRLTPVNGIGVPSTEAGRPIPKGARFVGSGHVAIGVVAPMDTSHLGTFAALGSDFWLGAFVGVVVVGAGVLGYKVMRHRA